MKIFSKRWKIYAFEEKPELLYSWCNKFVCLMFATVVMHWLLRLLLNSEKTVCTVAVSKHHVCYRIINKVYVYSEIMNSVIFAAHVEYSE